jgi:maltooligosyltrehalose trehalohydrolase
MARYVRDHIEPGRYVHLVLENDDNVASLMNEGFDAQWNDDAHHVLHHILTGETQGYYAAYEDNPTGKLGRVLQEGFVYQGEPTLWRGGAPRGEPSAGLPPSAFVFFLQNHDQIGNRAMGERLISLCRSNPDALYAAVALQLLTPHIPLLFMGEEVGAKSPFLYFTSFGNPELAQAVREGRRKEFAGFDEFADAQARERIPDPNDKKTWDHSKVKLDAQNRQAAQWRSWYGSLLQLRRKFITPHLAAARSDSVQMLAALCVVARWRLGNGSLLSLYCNFSQQNIVLAPGAMLEAEEVIFQSKRRVGGQMGSSLAATSTTATLTRPAKGADRKDVQ